MYLGLLLLLVDIGIYFLDTRAGFLLTCFLVFYFAMILYQMCIRDRKKGIPVGEVWGVCGFMDYSSFLRNFRKEYGMSPTSYRAYLEQGDRQG